MTQNKTRPQTVFRNLVFSALLLFSTGLTGTAMAQSVNAALPDLSPEQIARDVTTEFNNRTGAREFLAPTFDPFEEDSAMAGSARLRSVSAVTAIDGTQVRGGAVLDLGFYYNSASNDPYDTRGFEDAVFLSGTYAPVIRRDNRVLECSSNVRETVYEHSRYYSPSLLLSFYRPYRHYRGHYGYGYGSGGHGYWRRGGYGTGYGSGHGWRRGGYTGGVNPRRRRRPKPHPTTGPRPSVGDLGPDTVRPTRPRRPITDRDPERDGPADVDRRREPGYGGPGTVRPRIRKARKNTTPISRRRTGVDVDALAGGTSNRTSRPDRGRPGRVTRPNRVSQPKAQPTQQPAPQPRTRPTASPKKAKSSPPVSRPRSDRTSRPERSRASKPARRTSKPRSAPVSRTRGPDRVRMNFFPNGYYNSGGARVVTSQNVDCAREETLSVHIPDARLDAARFDGLTVLVLDRTGQEYPVFIPPNYIEGFRQASRNAEYQRLEDVRQRPVNPIYRPEGYQPPPPAAPPTNCPSGTIPQAGGTCLQTSNGFGAYPRP